MSDAISFKHQGDFGGSRAQAGDLLTETGATLTAPVFNFGPKATSSTLPWWGWALAATAAVLVLRRA